MANDLKLEIMLKAIDKATAPLKAINAASEETAEAIAASRTQLKELERAQRDLRAFQKFKRQADDSRKALDAERESARRLSREIERTKGDTSDLIRQRDAAIKQVDKLKQQYGEQTQQAQRLETQLRDVHGVTGDLAGSENSLANKIKAANSQLKHQQDELKKVTEQQKRLNAAAESYHRASAMGSKVAGAGATAAAAGGVALYGGAHMLAPGVAYGEAMSRVQALTRLDKEDPMFEALKNQARQLGSSTSFSATQAGDAQGFLAMAGFDPKAIMAAMPSMLDLAKAQGADLARTADISSNLLSGFGLDPSEMTRLADVITATTTRANVDLEMLGESMKYVAPVARDMGLSLEESAAMAGLLGNVGIQGSQAGTTLRSMMLRLSAPTDGAAGALQELGVNAKDAEGNLRNVPQILADVARATKDMGNAKRMEYLKDIFGEEPAAGMAELLNQQGAAGVEKFVGILEHAAGENARVAKVMGDNVKGDLDGLQSAWEEVGISLMETNKGPLRELIQTITDITRATGNWIKENPELAATIAKVATALAGIVAVGGSVVALLGALFGPLMMLNAVLAMNPILLAIAGIIAALGALVTAVYVMYRNWDQISVWFGQRWQDIKTAFDNGIAGITRLLMNWSPLGLIYQGIVAGLEAMGVEVPEMFSTLGGAIIDGLKVGIAAGLTMLGDTWTSLRNSASALFTELPGQFLELGSNLMQGLMDGISAKWEALKDKVHSVTDAIKSWFTGDMDINSPSRVFAGYGRNTLEGYQVGLEQQQQPTLRAVGVMSQRIRRAGAGLALAAAAPAMAAPNLSPVALPHDPGSITIDQRARLTASPRSVQVAGDTITLHVHAAPGMDERALAAHIERVLDDRARQRASRQRAALYDLD